MLENEKRKRKLTFKKTNLATWGEDEVHSDGEEKKDEEALLCLIALDDEMTKAFDSNLSCSSDNDGEIDDLYHELYDSLVKAKKDLKLKIVKNESLIEKIKSLEKENHDLNLLAK